MRPIWVLRVGAPLFIVALVGLIVVSSLEESLATGLAHVWSDPWGVTTLVDLYAGLFVVGAWICVLERRAARVLPWIAGLALVGNLATVAFVAWRSWRCATATEALLGERGRVADG